MFRKKKENSSELVSLPYDTYDTNGMLTCNIISCYRPGLLTTILKTCDGYFDLIRVVNGNPDDPYMVRLLERFSNRSITPIKVFNNKWSMDTEKFFKPIMDDTHNGEWLFWLCDDELPSVPLLEHIHRIVEGCELGGYTSVMVPFTSVQEYIPQQDMPEFIGQAIAEECKGFSKKFRCERLVKVHRKLRMTGPTHMGWEEPNDHVKTLTEYPIIHMKEDDGFVISYLWPMVIRPEGHGFSKDIADDFRHACNAAGIIGDEKAIMKKFSDGNIHHELKEWMWKHKHEIDGPGWSWFAIYYFKFHPEELPDGFEYVTDITFKQWIHMMGGNEGRHRFIERTRLHPVIKDKLLRMGFEDVGTILSLWDCDGKTPEEMYKIHIDHPEVWRRFDGYLYGEYIDNNHYRE